MKIKNQVISCKIINQAFRVKKRASDGLLELKQKINDFEPEQETNEVLNGEPS